MKAKKENKVYSITTEQEKQRYLKEGYDIYSDDGKLMEHSPLKKISYSQYDVLKKENDTLRKEITALKEENDALRTKMEANKSVSDVGMNKPESEQAEGKASGKKAGK